MLSGNGVKTVQCSYDPLCDPLRLKMLSGNGAQESTQQHKAANSVNNKPLENSGKTPHNSTFYFTADSDGWCQWMTPDPSLYYYLLLWPLPVTTTTSFDPSPLLPPPPLTPPLYYHLLLWPLPFTTTSSSDPSPLLPPPPLTPPLYYYLVLLLAVLLLLLLLLLLLRGGLPGGLMVGVVRMGGQGGVHGIHGPHRAVAHRGVPVAVAPGHVWGDRGHKVSKTPWTGESWFGSSLM